jgi:hypothetical protein
MKTDRGCHEKSAVLILELLLVSDDLDLRFHFPSPFLPLRFSPAPTWIQIGDFCRQLASTIAYAYGEQPR